MKECDIVSSVKSDHKNSNNISSSQLFPRRKKKFNNNLLQHDKCIPKTKIAIADYLSNNTETKTKPIRVGKHENTFCVVTLSITPTKEKNVVDETRRSLNLIKYEETNLLTKNDIPNYYR